MTAKTLQQTHIFGLLYARPNCNLQQVKSPCRVLKASPLVTMCAKRDWEQMPRYHIKTLRTESEQRIHPDQNRETTTNSMMTRSHNLIT